MDDTPTASVNGAPPDGATTQQPVVDAPTPEPSHGQSIWPRIAITVGILLLLIITAIVIRHEITSVDNRAPSLTDIMRWIYGGTDSAEAPIPPVDPIENPPMQLCERNEDCPNSAKTMCEGHSIVSYGCNGVCRKYEWALCAQGCAEREGWALCVNGSVAGENSTCEDDEQGLDPKARGTIKITSKQGPYTISDLCEEGRLREFYCDNGRLREAVMPCVSCDRGVCTPVKENVCVESDPDRALSVAGNATLEGYGLPMHDYCVENERSDAGRPQSDYAIKMHCVNNSIRREGVACHCVRGACISDEELARWTIRRETVRCNQAFKGDDGNTYRLTGADGYEYNTAWWDVSNATARIANFGVNAGERIALPAQATDSGRYVETITGSCRMVEGNSIGDDATVIIRKGE